MFFNPENGLDIDALWIDMNEASNFCPYPCTDPVQFSKDSGNPPTPPPIRTTWNPLPGFPDDFQPPVNSSSKQLEPVAVRSIPRTPASVYKRQSGGSMKGLPNRNFISPPYTIANARGALSMGTLDTDLIHANGLVEYDTHNLYGTMMSSTSRGAMLARRPTKRPLIITRSTFAGAGAHVGHWLGDNEATWDGYRQSIYQIMAFAGIYQVPMVGADVCGFNDNTTEHLCARWAMLGSFYPFFRNHAEYGVINHEFYVWPLVASAAKKAIGVRYQLLDYIYTAMYAQTQTGTPMLNAMWFLYPQDKNTLDIDQQFFYGDSVLVSPVTADNATSVDIYLPNDTFYDLYTYEKIQGEGKTINLPDVPFDSIPLHIRGGSIVPFRNESANTTTALREKDFNLVVALGADGTASGRLYMDDGESLEQPKITDLTLSYSDGKLVTQGPAEAPTNAKIAKVFVLGQNSTGSKMSGEGRDAGMGAWVV